jgi:hypothetical protein
MGVVSRSHAGPRDYLLSSTLDSAIGLLGLEEVITNSRISKIVFYRMHFERHDRSIYGWSVICSNTQEPDKNNSKIGMVLY